MLEREITLIQETQQEQKISILTENDFDKGYDSGYNTGHAEGFNEGYPIGFEDGKGAGYQEGYNIGEQEGFNNGKQEGYDEGKQAEYDEWWDNFQENGERDFYAYAFSGYGWTKDTFKPKYDIKPTNLQGLFFYSHIQADLPLLLEELGINIDFENATNNSSMSSTFQWSQFTHIGELNTTMSNTLGMTFNSNVYLVTIDKLKLREDGSQTFNATFSSCRELQNLTITGVIGQNFDIHYSTKLTHDSLMSIINALKDYSSIGGTYTLNIGATNIAKLTDTEKAIATQKGWTLA